MRGGRDQCLRNCTSREAGIPTRLRLVCADYGQCGHIIVGGCGAHKLLDLREDPHAGFVGSIKVCLTQIFAHSFDAIFLASVFGFDNSLRYRQKCVARPHRYN